jgi:hypothetical protein
MLIGYSTAVPQTASFAETQGQTPNGSNFTSFFSQNGTLITQSAIAMFATENLEGLQLQNGSTANGMEFFSVFASGATTITGDEGTTLTFSSSFVATNTFATSNTTTIPIGTSVGYTVPTFDQSGNTYSSNFTNVYNYSTNSTFSFNPYTTSNVTSTYTGLTSTGSSTYNTITTTLSHYDVTTVTTGTTTSTFIDALSGIVTLSLFSFDYVNSTVFLYPNEIAWVPYTTIAGMVSGYPLSALAYSTSGSFTIADSSITSALNIQTVDASQSIGTTGEYVTGTVMPFTAQSTYTNTETLTLTVIAANTNTKDSNFTSNSNVSVPDHIPNSTYTTTTLWNYTSEITNYLGIDSVSTVSLGQNPVWQSATLTTTLNATTTCYIPTYDINGIPIGFFTMATATQNYTTLTTNFPAPAATSSEDTNITVVEMLGSTVSTFASTYGINPHPQIDNFSILTPQNTNGVCLPTGYARSRIAYKQLSIEGANSTIPWHFVYGAQTVIFTPLPIIGSNSTVDTSSTSSNTNTSAISSTTFQVSWSSLFLSITANYTTETNGSVVTTSISTYGTLNTVGDSISNVSSVYIGGLGSSENLGGYQVNTRNQSIIIPGQAQIFYTDNFGSYTTQQTAIYYNGSTLEMSTEGTIISQSVVSTLPLYDALLTSGNPFFVINTATAIPGVAQNSGQPATSSSTM